MRNQRKQLRGNKMSRLMLAADLHLGHKNITKFRTQFSSPEEHHETVLENMKLSVNKADSLWLLGDIAFTKDWLVRLQEIKCRRKVLVLGNHCTDREVKFHDLIGVYDEVHALVSHRNYWFSHAPIHEAEIRGKLGNIHGHIHSAAIDSPYYQCISLEHTDYKAIPFEQVVNRFKEYKEK